MTAIGKKHTEETKQKISLSMLGKNHHPHSDERKEKIREGVKKAWDDGRFTGLRGRKHNIDYNKRNNLPSNLITLCASCHSKTNSGRAMWQEKFSKVSTGGVSSGSNNPIK